MSEDLTQSELLFNDNVDDIVSDIKEAVDDPNISNLERVQRVSALLHEMEEYTHPLISQIDDLSDPQKHLILCRIARVFPSIIQKELKSIVNWPRSKMNHLDIETRKLTTELSGHSLSESTEMKMDTLYESGTSGNEHDQLSGSNSKKQVFSKRRWSVTHHPLGANTMNSLKKNSWHSKWSLKRGHLEKDVVCKPHLSPKQQVYALKKRIGVDLETNSKTNSNSGNESIDAIHSEIEQSMEQKHAEDLSKILTRLGYRDVDELYRHSKPSQVFGQYVHQGLVKKESEKANSKKVDKQLKMWKKQKEQRGSMIIAQLKERKKSAVKMKIPDVQANNEVLDVPTKNDATKVMMMMGMKHLGEKDMHAICSAPTKALKLV